MAYSRLVVLLDDMKWKVPTRIVCVGVVVVVEDHVGVTFVFKLLHLFKNALFALVVASEAADHSL